MVASNSEMEAALQRVKAWSAESRIALARRVLESLDTPPEVSPPAAPQGPSSDRVLGLWSPGASAPTDEECEQILAEGLRRKHAS